MDDEKKAYTPQRRIRSGEGEKFQRGGETYEDAVVRIARFMDGESAWRLADDCRMMINISNEAVSVTTGEGGDLRFMRSKFREGRNRGDVIRYAIVRAAYSMPEVN